MDAKRPPMSTRRAFAFSMSRRSSMIAIVLSALLLWTLMVAVTPAYAVPPAPPNPSDDEISSAESAQQAAAAEVGRISGELAAAEGELVLA